MDSKKSEYIKRPQPPTLRLGLCFLPTSSRCRARRSRDSSSLCRPLVMATARADSQGNQYGRRRSNTVQSGTPIPLPLKLGDSKILNSWVHDPKKSPRVILNQSWWPGVAEGDVLRITASQSSDDCSGLLFTVPRDEGCSKPTLQISLPKNAADVFGLKNNSEITLTKVDKDAYAADYIELTFQDQYLGRNDMWRLSAYLAGQCVFVEQEHSFIGVIAVKVQNIYLNGKKVDAVRLSHPLRP